MATKLEGGGGLLGLSGRATKKELIFFKSINRYKLYIGENQLYGNRQEKKDRKDFFILSVLVVDDLSLKNYNKKQIF